MPAAVVTSENGRDPFPAAPGLPAARCEPQPPRASSPRQGSRKPVRMSRLQANDWGRFDRDRAMRSGARGERSLGRLQTPPEIRVAGVLLELELEGRDRPAQPEQPVVLLHLPAAFVLPAGSQEAAGQGV